MLTAKPLTKLTKAAAAEVNFLFRLAKLTKSAERHTINGLKMGNLINVAQAIGMRQILIWIIKARQ